MLFRSTERSTVLLFVKRIVILLEINVEWLYVALDSNK